MDRASLRFSTFNNPAASTHVLRNKLSVKAKEWMRPICGAYWNLIEKTEACTSRVFVEFSYRCCACPTTKFIKSNYSITYY